MQRLLAGRFTSRLLRRLGGFKREAPPVLRDDPLAALDGPRRTFASLRCGLRGERLPASMKVPEGRFIDRVVDAMTVPFEGLARADGVAPRLFDPLFFGIERVVLLLG